MRDIPKETLPMVAQLSDEGVSEFAEEENSKAAVEPKRPPSAMPR